MKISHIGRNHPELEQLVDSYGLIAVLRALAEICYEKAEHVRSAWQDERLGKVWERTGKLLDYFLNKNAEKMPT